MPACAKDWPRALPQALIAGKPVVSYDIDGAREVAINGETGFLVPPRWDALVEPLIKLAADAELRTRLGQTGRERFTEQFRHEFMTRRIRESCIERVLDREHELVRSKPLRLDTSHPSLRLES